MTKKITPLKLIDMSHILFCVSLLFCTVVQGGTANLGATANLKKVVPTIAGIFTNTEATKNLGVDVIKGLLQNYTEASIINVFATHPVLRPKVPTLVKVVVTSSTLKTADSADDFRKELRAFIDAVNEKEASSGTPGAQVKVDDGELQALLNDAQATSVSTEKTAKLKEGLQHIFGSSGSAVKAIDAVYGSEKVKAHSVKTALEGVVKAITP